MTRIEPADEIEGIVGAKRHPVHHLGRAVTDEQRVYILHSERCRNHYANLRVCPYSLALDNGIDVQRWAGHEDHTVRLWIDVWTYRLVPIELAEPHVPTAQTREATE